MMIRSFKTKTAALATVGVLTVAGGAYAATSATKAPTPITGSVTDKASAAALAKYPGSTLVGLQSRSDGTFEAQLRKADGTAVSVALDKDFKVTDAREGGRGFGGPGGHGGHGGPGGSGGPGGPGGAGPRGRADTAALAKALGVTEAKVEAATKAARPSQDDRGSDMVAAVAKALGAQEADVRSVLEDQAKTGGPGPRGKASGLVSALAKKTGKSEPDVRKALGSARPDRGDRRDDLAAALAKELGLDEAKVQKALEAQRPARP